MKLSGITSIRQKSDELVPDYIQRFGDMRNRCYNLNLIDSQMADLAFHGLLGPIRQMFSSQDFESLAHLAQKVSAHEQRFQEAKRFAKKSKNINNIYSYASDSEDEDPEIGLAEWSRNKKAVVCQWVKNTRKEERHDFDISKADRIFDLLLQEKEIPQGM